MVDFISSIWTNSKFSVIAFFVTLIFGFVSIGLLGILLYYSVSFVLRSYPTLNDWRGDWVWSATISVGMGWSLGFVFGGVTTYYFSKIMDSRLILNSIYALILWLWALILWLIVLKNNFK